MSATFDRLASERITIKRPGKDAPAIIMINVPCAPFAPVDEQVRARMSTQVGVVVLETFVEGRHDIRRGDIAALDGVDYPIREREVWTMPDGTLTLRLRMERVA